MSCRAKIQSFLHITKQNENFLRFFTKKLNTQTAQNEIVMEK